MNDEPTHVIDTQFEVTGTAGEFQESASVTVEDERIEASGTISGNNSCYTARLDDVSMVDDALIIGVESYDDSAEFEGCLDVIIGIHYAVLVTYDGARPPAVVVEHNGDVVTTEDGS